MCLVINSLTSGKKKTQGKEYVVARKESASRATCVWRDDVAAREQADGWIFGDSAVQEQVHIPTLLGGGGAHFSSSSLRAGEGGF